MRKKKPMAGINVIFALIFRICDPLLAAPGLLLAASRAVRFSSKI
jgi:hypothetical protein